METNNLAPDLHLVKANYAKKGAWAYTAESTGALTQVDIRVEQDAKDAEFDAAVLEHVPAHPDTIAVSPLAKIVIGNSGGSRGGPNEKVQAAMRRLVAAGHIVVNEKGNRWSTPAKTGGEG